MILVGNLMLWNMVIYYLFVLCKFYNWIDIKIFIKNFDVEKICNRFKYFIKIYVLKKNFFKCNVEKSKWYVVWYIFFYYFYFFLKCVICMLLIYNIVNVSDYISFEYVWENVNNYMEEKCWLEVLFFYGWFFFIREVVFRKWV